MPIEINEMVVNAILDETSDSGFESDNRTCGSQDLEDFKEQILSECREMFYRLILREGDR